MKNESEATCPDHLARGLLAVLALLMTVLADIDQAEAACAPAAPVNDAIVTCTGTTTDQNAPNGYGTGNETGITINIGAGASVIGTDPTGAAIHATTATVLNSGVITSPSFGVQTSGAAGITNSGTIESTARIAIVAGSVNVDNSGTVQAPAGQSALSTPGLATVKNAGLFVGGLNAIFSSGSAVNITDNTGTIRATDPNGRAINAATTATVTNSVGGVIEANGANGKAIQASTLATVTNFGLIQGLGTIGNAINAGAVDVTNSGTIAAPNNVAISSGDNAKVTNSGTITGRATAIVAAALADVANAAGGIIQATSVAGQSALTISGLNVLLNNAGTVQAGGTANLNNAVNAVNNATVENFGNIQASGAGSAGVVALTGTADVKNSGSIQQQGDGGAAIVGAEIAKVNNSGSIRTAGANGIAIFSPGGVTGGFADLTNSGLVSATGAGGVAISAGIVGGNNGSVVTVNNLRTGEILADTQAIVSNTGSADVTNAGTIRTSGDGSVINTSTSATVLNAGTIQSTGANSAAIFANGPVTVTNFGLGLISATRVGIGSVLDAVDVTNVGTITATAVDGHVIQAATTVTVNNSGTIQSAGATSFGINAAVVNATNFGRITGNTGIFASGAGGVGSNITNSGTIEGTGGTAIKLSPAADTLTLLGGSQIIGAIDMGGGADTINVVNNVTLTSRVSSFFRLLAANSLNIINFTGTLNTSTTVDTGGMPAVQTADGVATLDPTAFGQADRTLMDFTGGVASLVQGRLGGTAANVSGMQVVSFAPTHASDRTNEAFAALSAMAYGPERSRTAGKAPAGGYAPYAAPYNVWVSGFGGTRTQKADDIALRSASSAWGGVIGIDRQMRPDLLLGAFAGGGTGRLSVDLSSQSVDTDYFVGGVYGRFDWVTHFLDFTLQAGGIHNKSTRLVLNNLAPGGSENATASYNGWYVSPELAYGLRYGFGNGYTVTPVARLRYLAGALDGYSEAGSEQNLVVGRRSLNGLEERAEIGLSKITGFSTGAVKTSVHAGVIALQRLGSPTINTVLIGQDLSFTTPGKDSAVGAVAGAGFDVRTSANMSLFGAFEGTVMSDNSRTAAAKGGLRVMF